MYNEKCAPSKTFKDGSCLTLESLKSIATQYNIKNFKNKIEISNDKAKMVKELEKKLSDKCNDQICWLNLDVVNKIDDKPIKKDIKENTFRPLGPIKKNEWLSTSDINDVIVQYQEKHKDFLFLGAVPADFEDLEVLGINNLDFADLQKEGKNKIGIVINLDVHTQGGSHWVALFIDLKKGQIYYFDSFAMKPSKKTRKFINKVFKYIYKKKYNKDIKLNSLINKINGGGKHKLIDDLKQFDIKYNTIQHQFKNSECGVYSINFIVRLVGGETFDEVTENVTKDDTMNKCRTRYFSNVNIT